MNKWFRRLLKIITFFFLMLTICFIGAYSNKNHELSSLPLPLFIIVLMFAIPFYVCYSNWANKKIWKRNNSQKI